MGELIAALVEGIIALITVALEFLAVALEVLLQMAVATFTVIAYALSPRYREKKKREWADQPGQKYYALGLSSVCLVCLTALGIWFVIEINKPPPSDTVVQSAKPVGEEEARVRIKSTTKNKTNEITLAVKQGGMKKIMETSSLLELREAIRTNVSIVPKHGITNSTSSTNVLIPEVVEK